MHGFHGLRSCSTGKLIDWDITGRTFGFYAQARARNYPGIVGHEPRGRVGCVFLFPTRLIRT